ncbi:hypothetical protein [Nocardioides daeguensis]|uniref:LPXTG cell wall anchor domain-containing protein n=1 Tax=Nocardioides daeguensis TaxID=908359 RepID=A0ABP6VBT2_9ACTN|nr:hypothetical protein [Nocardioides daeguensis]MBV6726196.1 hypothetical protein [Nocardioides daeguensis]MCR1772039.1 hypothetical protein [Nocardioides daeguensis]
MTRSIAAHPFGDPQTVEVAADPTDPAMVHVTWKVGAADDLTLLGIHLGVLPEDRVMLDGAIDYDEGDAALVQQAPEVHSYLLEHVEVAAGGQSCDGRVDASGDLITDGADLVFTCSQPVASATVTVSTLTDLHPAYRALATGPDGQHQVYGADAPVHDWALGAATGATPGSSTGASTGASAALQIGGVLGAVLLVVVAGTLVVRRRRQATPITPNP